MSKNQIKLFEGQKVRSVWDEEKEEWYFSVVDIVSILTEQPDYTKTRNYWKWLKNRLTEEGSQLVSNTNQLKLPASDGKNYLTDVMTTEQILRIIQSVPSKKAEPFKLWLAENMTKEISQIEKPDTFTKNKKVAKEGGSIAGDTRKRIEKRLGRSVITTKNSHQLNA